MRTHNRGRQKSHLENREVPCMSMLVMREIMLCRVF